MLTRLTDEEYLEIHTQLHKQGQHVNVRGQTLEISLSKGRRYVRFGNEVIAQQDRTQKSVLAMRARTERISRVIRTGKKWAWISDNEVVDPEDKL